MYFEANEIFCAASNLFGLVKVPQVHKIEALC